MSEAIKVEGLKEFIKAVKQADRELGKAIRLAFNEAADLVVQRARPTVPERRGKAAGSVKASSTQKMARVSGGGARVPYYPWLDFGGRVGKSNSVSRTFKADGRYINPQYRRLRDSGAFQDVMMEELRKVAKRAGLELEDD